MMMKRKIIKRRRPKNKTRKTKRARKRRNRRRKKRVKVTRKWSQLRLQKMIKNASDPMKTWPRLANPLRTK